MKKTILFLGLIIFLFSFSFSEGITNVESSLSDDALFSEEIIIPMENIVTNTIEEFKNTTSFNPSGSISLSMEYSLNRYFLSTFNGINTNTTLSLPTSIRGSGNIDMRLEDGKKAFISGSISYSPQKGTNASINASLNEFFVDVNLEKLVFLKIGKQNLVWGKGALWNPSDSINKEKKNFLDSDLSAWNSRQGNYGIKATIPVGTDLNFYTFIDITGANKLEDFALAGKVEFIIFDYETSFSAWKNFSTNIVPVFGWDINGKLLNIDVYAEASLSYGENQTRMRSDNTIYTNKNVFVPKITFGGSKGFELFDVENRVQTSWSIFINPYGYSLYDDKGVMNNYFTLNHPQRNLFFSNNLYNSQEHGQFYASLSLSVSKIIDEYLNCSVRLLGNFSDYSYLLSTGLSYSRFSEFPLRFSLTMPIGPENREFTMDKGKGTPGITASFSTSVSF